MARQVSQSLRLTKLKVYTVQWAYLLYGLRDGWPYSEKKVAFSGSQWRPRAGFLKERSKGRITFIPFVRIFLHEGTETADKVFDDMHFRRGWDEAEPGTALLKIETKGSPIPQRFRFGLTASDSCYFAFQPVRKREDLWNGLLNARDETDLREIAGKITRWVPHIPGYRIFRDALEKHGTKLGEAKEVWIYPRDRKRPTSDDKRIEFFAKALAGFMVGWEPATAAKKLSHWKIPKLWIANYEKVNEMATRGISNDKKRTELA